MKHIKFTLALLFALCLPATMFATQVRGTLLDANGKAMTGAVILFELGGCSDANGIPTLVAGGVLVQKTYTVIPGPGGVVIAQIVGNDQILCGGGTNTWWVVTAKVNGVTTWTKSAIITGGLWHVDQGPYLEMTPTATPQEAVLKNSNYDQIVHVATGKRLEIQGTVVANITGTLIGNANTATALAGTPAACTGHTWLKSLTSAGVTTCTQPSFADLSGSLGSLQFSDTGVTAGTYTKITVDAKGRATTGATTASSDLSDGNTLAKTSGLNIFSALQTLNDGLVAAGNSATDVPVIVKGYTSQSTDLTQWKNSSDTTLAKVTKEGYVSAPQFQIDGTALASTHLTDSTQLVRNNANQSINGTVAATGFSGPLTGNVNGNVNGTTVTASGTVQGATVNATSGYQVNSAALTWSHLSGKMGLTYLANCSVDGQIPKWTSSGGWACDTDRSVGTGAVVFTALSDVPGSYSGQGGKALRVNSGATGLEFYDATGLSAGATNTWSAEQIFSVAPVLNNNIPVRWKNSGGTSLDILNFNASNQVILGGGTGGTIFLQPSIGTTLLGLTGTKATVTGTLNATTDLQLNGTAYKDATQTFTNKTFDAEAAGNIIKLPSMIYAQAAGCEGVAPYGLFDLPTTNNPAAVCVTGTNQQKGVLRYSTAGTQWSTFTFAVPGDQTGTYDVRVLTVPTTTAAASWTVSYACTSANVTDDPTWTAWTPMSVSSSGANGLGIGTLSGVTGCAAAQLMHVKVARTDTTGPAQSDLLGVELTIRRSM